MNKKQKYKKHLENYSKPPKSHMKAIDKCLTVGDLKKAIQSVPDDTPVLVRNYDEPMSCAEVVCRQVGLEEVPYDSPEEMNKYTEIFAIDGVSHDPEVQKGFEKNILMED